MGIALPSYVPGGVGGGGIDHQERKNIVNPRGYARGGGHGYRSH